jgi:poly-beta-1,6-N-acetyl-D-glucosamine synthase
MIECTVGVMAYNEAANIGRLLDALLAQRLDRVAIRRIVVVASGCTDDTVPVVRARAAREPRVHLVVQSERRGKAAAINEFLPLAVGGVVVLESADTIPHEDAVETLVRPFSDPAVGMTGARPVPTNDPRTFWGHAAHLLWGLHHDIAVQRPKLGELIAFRNSVVAIPETTAVDEASIEARMAEEGLEIRYVPEAIVYNGGPNCARDFVRQRRRIYIGHLHLRDTTGYGVSTMSVSTILRALARRLQWSPQRLAYTAGVVALEAWARGLATYDYRVGRKNPYVWDIADTTKTLGTLQAGLSADKVDPWPSSSVTYPRTG